MAGQSSIFKSFASLFAPRASQPTNEASPDEEQLFLTSIAHLSTNEQRQQLQRRTMYRRMVQRQGIMEAEQRATTHNGW